MNASSIFDYASSPKERVAFCNLCGGTEFVNLATSDRYGYPVRTDGCLDCGLVFLNPRMTKYAYARFYEAHYRPLVSAYHGRVIDSKTIQPEQKEYAERLANTLWPFIGQAESLLDIGGSTGVVARHLATEFGLHATVLDPCAEELKEASGVEIEHGTIEDFRPNQVWDLVTMCQTADHLLDVSGALRKIRGLISPDGLFFVDILDWEKTKQSKVDHPFNLTEATMRAFLDRSGFRPIAVTKYASHIGFVCR